MLKHESPPTKKTIIQLDLALHRLRLSRKFKSCANFKNPQKKKKFLFDMLSAYVECDDVVLSSGNSIHILVTLFCVAREGGVVNAGVGLLVIVKTWAHI